MRKNIGYVTNLIKFSVKNNVCLIFIPFLAVASSALEIGALSVIYPLLDYTSINNNNIFMFFCSIIDGFQAIYLIYIFLFLFVMKIFVQLLYSYFSFKSGKKIFCQLATGCFENIVKNYALNNLYNKGIGHYIALAGDESFRASNLIIDISNAASSLLMTIAYMLSIYILSLKCGIAVSLFIIFNFLLIFRLMGALRKLGVLQVEQTKAASSVFLDALNGIRTVRCFQAEAFVISSYLNKMIIYTKTLFKIDYYPFFIKSIPVILLLIGGAFGLYAYDYFNSFDFNSIGFMIMMVFCVMRLLSTAGPSANVLMRVYTDAKIGQDVTTALSAPCITKSNSKNTVTNIKELRLDRVFFGYDDVMVIKDFSAKFVSNTTYAILGPSGSGKSTLLNLLSLLVPYSSGEITINGESIISLDNNQLRSKILLVEQDVTIFNDTVYNNLSLGLDVSLDEVRQACKICLIDDHINRLDNGYDTVLTYQGGNLSGGQKQRLSIARAVLRNPDVFLFDEITSALDAATCQQIVANIKSAFRDKIMIFVTHDEKIISFMDEALQFTSTGLTPYNSNPTTKALQSC